MHHHIQFYLFRKSDLIIILNNPISLSFSFFIQMLKESEDATHVPENPGYFFP